MSFPRTDLGSLEATFSAQRAVSHEPAPVAVRRDRLRRCIALLQRYGRHIVEAIHADFGNRSEDLSVMTDLYGPIQSLRHAHRLVRRWMRAESRRLPFGLGLTGVRARIRPVPKGVVGVISPWNFPVNLIFSPLAGVLAAGNRAMIKPSEHTPATAALIRDLVRSEFDESELAVVTGGVEVGAAFSRLPFDHLIFTGSTHVGRQVMAAAAENLTPVTLELGGKSPVVVRDCADIDLAARRIVAGKLVNAGQICMAPDHVYVPRGRLDDFVEAVRNAARRLYPTLRSNPDYTTIIHDRHVERLSSYIEEAIGRNVELVDVNPGAESFDPDSDRRFPFILLVNPPEDLAVMREEIFGPILPVLSYDSVDAVVNRLRLGPRPLALYLFEARRRAAGVLRCAGDVLSLELAALAGAICINDVVGHVAVETLPLGGIGDSGMGRYHGIDGFREFSHLMPVYRQGWLSTTSFITPPFGPAKRRLAARLTGLGVADGDAVASRNAHIR